MAIGRGWRAYIELVDSMDLGSFLFPRLVIGLASINRTMSSITNFGLSDEHLAFVSKAIDSASAELRKLNLEVISGILILETTHLTEDS